MLAELKKSVYADFPADEAKTIRDDGQDIDGLPTEGIEITCFHLDGAHYMIYTPSDPLLFVAFKDQNGILQIADDVSNILLPAIDIIEVCTLTTLSYELLEDPAIMSAIDEETEFNALVEEEAALLESLLGER
ncbi:Porphobilinogen deaminase [Gossypium australe]|uniref:Porphobilinogen deaminase n=1 Tax=Gossypium australe TaxID=47621 RepID=A0A5B6V609_9ROSI|nr:Porphobilinogen deaminase [Gossypium australe]